MRSDSGRLRESYPYRADRAKPRGKKHAGASLGFCWGFGVVVCLTFGLASFLMFSAGHFSSFSSGLGVEPAHGIEESFSYSRNLLDVEVTQLDPSENIADSAEFYTHNYNSKTMEEFGPFPSYLSDYESITLSTADDGKTLRVHDEDDEDDDFEEASVTVEVSRAEEPILLEEGPGWREHTVKSGETLSSIAGTYGNITAQDIIRANLLIDGGKISENQILLIPSTPENTEDTLDEVRRRKWVVATNNSDGKYEPLKVSEYVVVPGDSLWSISDKLKLKVDIETIRGSNNFRTSSGLRPGVKLRIPNQDGIFYTLKDGEKIEEVAKRYRVSMNKIRLVNAGVDVASLKANDEIFLPGAKPEALRESKPSVKLADTKKPEPAKKSAPIPAKTAVKPERRHRGEVAVRATGFRWPIMGRINSPFGWRTHPITRHRDFHTGIDIKANRNDPIRAAGSGHVVYSGWMGGYGKVLVIEHNNGQSTLYAHCSTLLFGKGASVSSGQLVAKIGTTGRSTGPHLHFEVRNGSSPVNPIKYLSR